MSVKERQRTKNGDGSFWVDLWKYLAGGRMVLDLVLSQGMEREARAAREVMAERVGFGLDRLF
jgi:hypothetical protein